MVVLGEYNLKVNEGHEQVIPIRDWINHPDYRRIAGSRPGSQHGDNDFAIIKLESHVIFNDHILPVCLPSNSKNYDDVNATVSGFGRTTCPQEGRNHEDELQKVTTRF